MVGLAFLSAGCSFTIGFTIKNLSDQTIAVSYSVKDVHYGLSPRLVRNGAEEEYFPVPSDRIKIDTVNRVVEINLLADEEVELFWVPARRANDYEKEFSIASLSVSSIDGTTSLEGREIFKSFRPIKSSWYQFGPEITGFVFEYR